MGLKNAPEIQLSQKKGGFDRAIAKFGAYFESKGLAPSDIPAAIIVHELLGMLMASAMWAVSVPNFVI